MQTHILPVIIKRDETKYWKEDLVKEAGKIYGYYLYDLMRPVCICEARPYYELYALYPGTENEVSDETRERIEQEFYDGTARYEYCHVLNSIPKGLKYTGHTFDIEYEEPADPEEDYNAAMDKVIEYYKANVVCL